MPKDVLLQSVSQVQILSHLSQQSRANSNPAAKKPSDVNHSVHEWLVSKDRPAKKVNSHPKVPLLRGGTVDSLGQAYSIT